MQGQLNNCYIALKKSSTLFAGGVSDGGLSRVIAAVFGPQAGWESVWQASCGREPAEDSAPRGPTPRA